MGDPCYSKAKKGGLQMGPGRVWKIYSLCFMAAQVAAVCVCVFSGPYFIVPLVFVAWFVA